jgi:MinD-like ATPase involved in chromosome partitioning or flagellar assembly
MTSRVAVLLAAGGEAWEATALRLLGSGPTVVIKRCVDVPDLIASAGTGEADVAVVAGGLVGLDADAVVRLLRQDVRCVAVGGVVESLDRIGVVELVPPEEISRLPEAVSSAGTRDLVPDPQSQDQPEDPPARSAGENLGENLGRIVAVHGPAGAPGRTTVAIGLAALHAHRGSRSVLVDADPFGGSVAQHLGVLDEVSGLLAAARLVNVGSLDPTSFARCRRVVNDRFEVLTGLPRPDRWVEARPGVLDAVLERATEVGDVVVDTGFSLEDDADVGRNLSRNQLTLDAVAAADQVVIVGSAEPTGLARLARSLVEVRDTSRAPVTVVVNRMRDSLGWSRRDIIGMVEGYSRPTGVHFLPEDRATTDKALVTGRSVTELGDSALRRALAQVHEAVLGAPAQKPPISR